MDYRDNANAGLNRIKWVFTPAMVYFYSGVDNPLTSLNEPFQIPTMPIVTWRGQPGLKDELQHALMGEITSGLLDVMRIPHLPFPNAAENIGPALDDTEASMATRSLPFAFIMPAWPMNGLIKRC